MSREAGPVKGGKTVIAFVDDPTGYKFELIQREGQAIPEPLAQVGLLAGWAVGAVLGGWRVGCLLPAASQCQYPVCSCLLSLSAAHPHSSLCPLPSPPPIPPYRLAALPRR